MALARHIAGLVFAVALACGLWWVWDSFRGDLRGLDYRPITRDGDWLIALLVAFIALTAGERLWALVSRLMGPFDKP